MRMTIEKRDPVEQTAQMVKVHPGTEIKWKRFFVLPGTLSKEKYVYPETLHHNYRNIAI